MVQLFGNACLLCKQGGFFLLGHVKVDLAANLQIVTTVAIEANHPVLQS